MYGKMDYKEAISRVKKYMEVQPEDFTNKDIPLLHIQKPDKILERPYNIVIILEESLGAEYVGALGGLPLTPEFDKLFNHYLENYIPSNIAIKFRHQDMIKNNMIEALKRLASSAS